VAVRRREIFGWAMYDFANSSYTTVVVTVYYAVAFPKIVVGDGPDYRLGNLLWGVTLATSYLLSVALLPFLGAWMDGVGHRKRFLFASTAVTVLATAGLGLVGPGDVALAMALLVISNVAFSVGESFVASFLPDLGPPEVLGRISGAAWGLGYLGGLGSTSLVLFGLGAPDLSNPRVHWSGPITAAWFALAALPTFLLLRDRYVPPDTAAPLVARALGQLRDTLREARSYRDLLLFLTSYFFAMGGLTIVVAFAFIYGDQVVGWSAGTQSAMFVLTQLTATAGALLFGWLQGRIGDKPAYVLSLVVWIGAVVLLWQTPALGAFLRGALSADLADEHVFLGVGAAAGLCIGATQSAGRTLVALLSPEAKVGEFFGLWGVFGKLAAAVSLVSLSALQTALGLRNAILVTGAFFLAALAVAQAVDVRRGRERAGRSAG
jgi:UMF1 family MFS transporter